MLNCKYQNNIINCFDSSFNKNELKQLSKQNELKCPICNNLYEYCHGKIRLPYFRHKEKDVCFNMYSELETDEHLKGKLDLFKWIKSIDGVTNVKLESWIEETAQSPDIMFEYNDEIYAVEYQCSPISTEYIERHQLYESVGINDIWICGAKKYFECFHTGTGNKRVNTLEAKSRMYYDPFSELFFIVDTTKKRKDFSKGKNNLLKSLDNKLSDSKQNLFRVKSSSIDFTTKSRRNRKGWSTISEYTENNSMADCYKLNNITLDKIMREVER